MTVPRQTPRPARPAPRHLDADLPRSAQTFPPGTFTRVYAPSVDPVRRVWVWPPRPDWSGLPVSERKERRR